MFWCGAKLCLHPATEILLPLSFESHYRLLCRVNWFFGVSITIWTSLKKYYRVFSTSLIKKPGKQAEQVLAYTTNPGNWKSLSAGIFVCDGTDISNDILKSPIDDVNVQCLMSLSNLSHFPMAEPECFVSACPQESLPMDCVRRMTFVSFTESQMVHFCP